MLRVKVTPICLLVAMVGAMTDINTVTDGPIHTTELNIPTGPKIYYLHIKSDIRFRFATTVVTSKLVNPDTRAHQTTFEVTLPNEAFITNFTLSVRNQTYAGEVKTKEAARQEYESAVTQGRTAAHISVRPRETNKFNIDVNVAAEEKLTFELRYQELLQRKLGAYNHVIYVKPGEPVSDLRVDVDIFESRAINNLKVPPIRNDLLTNIDITSTNDLAVIEHISDRNVHVRYQPNMEQQTSDGIDGQFTVSYDVERQTDGGDILMVNGYFVHFFAPSGLEPRPKDIVFILDKSGSMSGTKFQQLKEAMLTILSQIDPVDKFNIITFDSSITRWRDDHLVPASESAIQQAKKYVNNLRANGGTNIQAAMLDGISQLELRTDRSRSAVIIFLTDGEATTGETTPKRILSRVAERNEDRVPVFSLAFGRNADFNLVKRMAVQNNGFGRKVYEDSDASLQISNFYTEVSTVLLKNVTFNYLNGTVVPDTLICDLSGLLKLGSELVVSGRLSSEEVVDLQPHITGIGSNGLVNLIVPDTAITTQLDITQDSDIIAITEKLWAYLTIKQWTRQMEAATNKEAAEDWRRNITEMALKYHFVTPMTSMVVTLPDELKVSPIKVEEDEIPVEEDDSMQPPIMTAKYNSGGRSGMTPLSGGGGMVGPSLMHARTFTQTSGIIPQQRSRTSYDTYYISRKRQGSRQPLKKSSGKRKHRLTGISLSRPSTIQTYLPHTTTVVPETTHPTSTNVPTTTSAVNGPSTTGTVQLTTRAPISKKMIRTRTKASDYTLVAVKGVDLPLCFRNPDDSIVDTTTMYNLSMDPETGTSVSVGYTFYGSGRRRRSRITRIIFTTSTNTTTEIIPGFRIDESVRQRAPFYSIFGKGNNLKWEVVNKKNKLTLLVDFTSNTNRNMEGSLVIPVRGKVRSKSKSKTKLILNVEKGGSMLRLKTRVKFSKPMQCWVTKTNLLLNI